MKTNVNEFKIMLALYGLDVSTLDFTRPVDLAQSLKQAIKYDNVSEAAEQYIIKKRLLAWGGYNKYEASPMGAWK